MRGIGLVVSPFWRRSGSGACVGLYEPVHGSAPDIAGQNKANPLGAIGSVAAMLSYSFGLQEEAAAVEAAIESVLRSGRVTADLRPAGKPATTEEVGTGVCAAIGGRKEVRSQESEVWGGRLLRKFGIRMWCMRRRGHRHCCSSICIWCTR